MIQNIFLPEKIGEYYIFSQRIVGIDITRSHIHATIVNARGSTITIEKQLSEPLTGPETSKYTERVVATLTTLKDKLGSVSQIRTPLASTNLVFKELKMPFTTADKINMVIKFEVEPLLPFAAQDAVIDFIITHVNEQENSSQVLVAAAQKQHIADHLALFEQAGIDPAIVTVDMFALYGLYNQIPSYTALPDTVILLDLDKYNTRIVAIHNNQLRIIRALPYGIATVAKQAGAAANISPTQAMDHIIRFGSTQAKEGQEQVISSSLKDYFSKVQFAISSTTAALHSTNLSKILLVGSGADIKDVAITAKEILGTECELFDIQLLTQNKKFQIAQSASLTESALLSLAAAVPSPILQEFNLRRGVFEPVQTALFLKQVITPMILIVILFGSLITHTVIQKRRLYNEIRNSQQEAVEELQKRFPEIPQDNTDLDEETIQMAKDELAKEEAVWMAYSSKSRASFLEYLLELSSRINKQQLGFKPEHLTITEGTTVSEIILKASVRDFEALKQLEQALSQSKLFSYVEPQNTPDFTMKIIVARTL